MQARAEILPTSTHPCSSSAVGRVETSIVLPCQPAHFPFVSVLIVNFNGKHFLEDCLTSLAGQTYPRERWEVIVVDNRSRDGSVAFLTEKFPWAQVIVCRRNLGFAGGNNAGILHARGEWIALLNNDTQVDSRWLEGLVDTALEDRRIGGVTSKILLKDKPGIINSTGLNLYRDGRAGDRGFGQTDSGQFDEPAEVFGACGASVLLRRQMLDDVGLFDERFFMYCEDLDLAWRARLRGWRFYYTPRSVVYHVHCGTSGEWSPFFIYHAERNTVFVNVKNAPVHQVLRAVIGFGGRGMRKWFRVLTGLERGQRARQQAGAYFFSWFSLMAGLPEMVCKRFQSRWWRRQVLDRELAPFITAKPPQN